MHELRGEQEPGLPDLLAKLADVDLVIVEGFKSEAYPKIEIHRQANGKPTLFQDDPTIIGIATDAVVSSKLPIAGLDDVRHLRE